MQSILRVVVWLLLFSVLTFALLLEAVALWIRTDSAHETIARAIETQLTHEIQGSIRIGRITNATTSSLHAHDVRFFAPDGEVVIVADELDLHFRASALLRGRVVTTRASVVGGRVIARVRRSGEVGLDLAFRAQPSGSPSTSTDAPVDFQALSLSRVNLVAGGNGAPDTTISGIRCTMHIWVPQVGAKVRFTLRDLRARIRLDAPVPLDLATSTGRVEFDGAARERASVDLRGSLGGTPRVRLLIRVLIRGADARIVATLHVPNTGAYLAHLPLILEGRGMALASSSFEFDVVTD